MAETSFRSMTRDRRLKVGHILVEFASPGIGHMLKNAGCDFVFFDMEHSGFQYETVKSVLRYFEAAGLPAAVRPPSKDYHHVARALDMGAEGIVAPMVGSAEDARALLRAMKFSPEGSRGVAPGIAHDRYAGGEVLDKLRAANERTTLIALVETAEGVENAEAIAAVDGVDCIWIGHFDLSASMGIPGEFANPRFLDALAHTRAACKRHGKSIGRMLGDAEAGAAAFAEGFDFLIYSGDVWLYQAALTSGVAALRAGCRGEAG